MGCIESYSSHVQKSLKIQNTVSDQLPLTGRVPQRFIIDPVLFTLYVNDLLRVPKHCEPLWYVDDTKLLLGFPSSKLNDVISAVNLDKYIERYCFFVANTLSFCPSSFVHIWNALLAIYFARVFYANLILLRLFAAESVALDRGFTVFYFQTRTRGKDGSNALY